MEQFPRIDVTNISGYFNREEIVMDTIAQIMKDFGLFGIKISFSGDLDCAYQELHQQLVIQVEELMTAQSELLYSILYQVDISQKDLKRSEALFPDYSPVELLAHEIIFRDLKKVLYRRHYR